jgi:hypothetical protein
LKMTYGYSHAANMSRNRNGCNAVLSRAIEPSRFLAKLMGKS